MLNSVDKEGSLDKETTQRLNVKVRMGWSRSYLVNERYSMNVLKLAIKQNKLGENIYYSPNFNFLTHKTTQQCFLRDTNHSVYMSLKRYSELPHFIHRSVVHSPPSYSHFNMCPIQGTPALSLSLIHEPKCTPVPLMRMAALNHKLLITAVYGRHLKCIH